MSDRYQEGESPAVLALIPARGGSKGVPNKNARQLAGKPLVAHACQCAQDSRLVTRIIVSTDCPRLASLAREAGAEVPFLRPAALAGDDSPTCDVVSHAVDWLHKQEDWQADIILLLQPTSPLRRGSDVDAALDTLKSSSADGVVSVVRVPAHYHPEWQFDVDGHGRLKLVTHRRLQDIVTQRQLLTTTFIRNGAIYAIYREAFERTGSLYGDAVVPYEMPSERSINIDSLADWAQAESLLRGASPPTKAA